MWTGSERFGRPQELKGSSRADTCRRGPEIRGRDPRHAEGSQEPLEGFQRPAEGSRRPAEGDQRPAEGDQRTAKGWQRPVAVTEGPAGGFRGMQKGSKDP